MKKTTFYSFIKEKDIVGLRKHDGYEVYIINNVCLNCYQSAIDNNIYLIDARAGVALWVKEYLVTARTEEELKRMIIDAILELETSEKFEEFLSGRSAKSYQLLVRTFRSYLTANALRERQEQVALSEMKNLITTKEEAEFK